MPAKYRLSRAEFARMRGFKRIPGAFFSLSYGFLPERSALGVACVVSAKTASHATVRNRIKRRTRAVLHTLLKHVPAPHILVFHAKKPASGASSQELVEDIRSLLKKAGIHVEPLPR